MMVLRRAWAVTSQWSLTFEVRKRRSSAVIAGYIGPSQWSLTFEVRKSVISGYIGPNGSGVAMEPDL